MEQSSTNWAGADVGEGSDQPLITWTIFPNVKASNFYVRRTTLHELAQHIVDAGPYQDKGACPLIKLAKFGSHRTGAGAMRSNENVECITGVEGDYDAGVIPPEDAVQMLERAGIRAIVYTTPNHMVFDPPKYNGGPRWRVLAPFSTDYPPQERDRFLARVNGALGGILAPESFTLSQTYFYGEVAGVEHRLFVTFDDPEDGSCVDELHELDAIGVIAKPPKQEVPEGQRKVGTSIKMFQDEVDKRGRLLRTGDQRRALLKEYIASRSARGLLREEILLMVEGVVNTYFDPADPPDAKDLMTMVDHFVRADTRAGKTSQPVTLSILDKIGLKSNGVVVDQDTGEITQPEPRKLFTHVGDLLGNLKPIQWLVESYLETDALSLVYGPSGGGKSFTVVDIACCIATGTSWHGMPVKQGPVFYIAGEGHNGLARRFAAWQKARGVELRGAPIYKSNKAIMMLDAMAASEMAAEVASLCDMTGQKPSLVIIDTLARNFGDGDENKTQDANRYIEHVDAYIRRVWGCNVMTVHHSGHDSDRARGSSSFKGAVDQEIWVKGQNGLIEMQVTKMKEAEIPSGRNFKIAQVGLGVEDECGVEIMGAYLEVDGCPLDFPVGKRANGTDIKALDVAKAMHPRWPGVPPMVLTLGCSERSLSRIMKTMRDQGLVTSQKGSKGYDLAEKAIQELSMTGFLLLEKGV